MNLRPTSPGADKVLSKGKFDFSTANTALDGMKLGIRNFEQKQ